MMRRLLTVLLRGYQLAISPYLGRNCRFHPNCSEYAIQAIDKYGCGRGAFLAARRISSCHPWNPGGYDPVP